MDPACDCKTQLSYTTQSTSVQRQRELEFVSNSCESYLRGRAAGSLAGLSRRLRGALSSTAHSAAQLALNAGQRVAGALR